MAKVKMILQTRDIEILKFIAKFGYVTSVQIQNFFELKQPRASRLLNRLIKHDYIKKERILADEPNIFTLRTAGAELVKSNRVKKITLQNLKHNLLLVDVYIILKLKNPELNILSDRELRAGRGFGAKGHVPDMEIVTPEQNGKKNIAIELELSRKSLKRVKSIIYSLESKYIETHYYCANTVFDHIKRAVSLKENFKVFNYFKLEEAPQIAEIVKEVESNAGDDTKDNKIKLTKLENVLRMKEKELLRSQEKVEKLESVERQLREVRWVFESVNFEKAWGGLKLSVSDYENLTKIIRG